MRLAEIDACAAKVTFPSQKVTQSAAKVTEKTVFALGSVRNVRFGGDDERRIR